MEGKDVNRREGKVWKGRERVNENWQRAIIRKDSPFLIVSKVESVVSDEDEEEGEKT